MATAIPERQSVPMPSALPVVGHRFDSFEREELDSFLVALGRALAEALNTINRLPIQQRFAKRAQVQYEAASAR